MFLGGLQLISVLLDLHFVTMQCPFSCDHYSAEQISLFFFFPLLNLNELSTIWSEF